MTTSTLPQPLVERYWFEVEWELRHRYQMDPQGANDVVRRYRALMAGGGVGDMVYHTDVSQTAATLAGPNPAVAPALPAAKPGGRRPKARK